MGRHRGLRGALLGEPVSAWTCLDAHRKLPVALDASVRELALIFLAGASAARQHARAPSLARRAPPQPRSARTLRR